MNTATDHTYTSQAGTVPIRRLTLYKHGVAFVERLGPLTGEAVRLVFRADEINDALKSLLVIDRHGGQVLGVHYDTPADLEARLDQSPIRLSADRSLLDLLRGLRGWSVRLVTGDASRAEEIVGRLIGVDIADHDTAARRAIVALVDETTGAVRVLSLGDVREVRLVEERARDDLAFFLDISRGEAAQRTVEVRLSPGEHDLAISYLVPSPTWRVSYRLVAESAPAAEPNAGEAQAANEPAAGGTLLLQGWGIFDNRLEEDLRDVAVTLVAGQPISFIYDLAASHIPERPVVHDPGRIAPGPVEYEAYGAMTLQDASSESIPTSGPPMHKARMARSMAAPRPAASISDMARQTAGAAGSDAGELFEYRVVAPVSVKRGESTLAPILQAELPYRRELLFNQSKLPRHPVAALRFTNSTGLVLERGPVTVLLDGAYHGEAIVPFSKADDEVYLATAVELGVKVDLDRRTAHETAGIRIAGALLHLKQAVVTHTTYQITSSLNEQRAVLIEHPLAPRSELVDTPAPAARTPEYARWSVVCPPRGAASFTVVERRYEWQVTELLDVAYARLEEYLRRRWLDQPALDRIRALLDARAAMTKNQAELVRLASERDAIYSREEQLRKNMQALSASGDEGALRKQVVGELQAAEERVRALHTRIAELQADTERRQAQIDAELESIEVPDALAEAPHAAS